MKVKMWLSVLVFVLAMLPAQGALANTCNGACGGGSADGSCYCDEACFDYGDCCGDICTACPTLAGCGGGNPDPGGCGSVSYEGCCQGETLQYCENGSVQTIDCGQNPSCGWQPDGPYYDCGTAGGADPSGMNPKACSGGTGPICGNGSCEPGENATSCPSDCGGGTNPVCGNGACEQGEDATSCPADCGQGCGGKQCGFDAQGNPCGSCPEGSYCTWDGQCESDTPCEPSCDVGQQCGDDGCGGQCGSCPAGLVCSEANTCISPFGQDVVAPEGDVSCTPDCTGKVCGGDGCGGLCGACPEGYGCTAEGMCEEGYVEPETDVYVPGEDPYACPPGETLLYGKCVAQGDDDGSGGNCSTGRANPLTAALLAFALLAALATARRRRIQ